MITGTPEETEVLIRTLLLLKPKAGFCVAYSRALRYLRECVNEPWRYRAPDVTFYVNSLLEAWK